MSAPNIEPGTQDCDSIQIMISRAKAICKVNTESLEIIKSRKGQKVIVDREYVLVEKQSPPKRKKVGDESVITTSATTSPNSELTFVSRDIKKDIDTIIQNWRYKGEKLEKENISIGSSYIARSLVNFQDLLCLHKEYQALITGYSKVLADYPDSRAAVAIVLKNTEILQVAIGKVHMQVIDVRNDIEDNKEVDACITCFQNGIQKMKDTGVKFTIDIKSVTEGTLTKHTSIPEFNAIEKLQCQRTFKLDGCCLGSRIEPYSIDGMQYVASRNYGIYVQLWNVRDCSKVGTLTSDRKYSMRSLLSFEIHGVPMLAGGSVNGKVILWNLITKREVSTLLSHTSHVNSLQIHKYEDKMFLISGSVDGSVQVWDLDTYKVIKTINSYMGYITALQVISRNGKDYLAVAAGTGVGVWCLSQYTKSFELSPSYYECIAYINHNNDALLAGGTENGLATIWNFKDDQPTKQNIKLGDIIIEALEWIKSDGKLCLVSGGLDGWIRVWDMASNSITSIINNGSSINVLRGLKRNGRACILTFDGNCHVKVWEEPVDES